ncbi:hypothetical protein GZH46_02135, partial [Fragariocoptes setiger]
ETYVDKFTNTKVSTLHQQRDCKINSQKIYTTELTEIYNTNSQKNKMSKLIIRQLATLTLLALVAVNLASAGQGCPFDNGSCQEYCATQGCHVGYCGHFAWIQCICRKCGTEWSGPSWYDKVRNRGAASNSTEVAATDASTTLSNNQNSEQGGTEAISDESAERILFDFIQNSSPREGRLNDMNTDNNNDNSSTTATTGNIGKDTDIVITPPVKEQSGFVIASASHPNQDTVIVKTGTDSSSTDGQQKFDIVNDIIMRLKPLMNKNVNERISYRVPLTYATHKSSASSTASTAKTTNIDDGQDTSNEEDNTLPKEALSSTEVPDVEHPTPKTSRIGDKRASLGLLTNHLAI